MLSRSQVTIAELDARLVQTGRTFNTTMNDDGGAYSVRGVQLGTPYARVEVSGFYFDEVRGQLSASPLSIFSYVDLSDRTTSNINLLGHLEAARLEHLVSEEQVSFAAAKAQAHREVLSLFQIDPASIGSAEDLDISKEGEGNAALFAISIMLQGTRTVAELSELLSNIQSDLKRDGTLDDAENGSALMAGATLVNLSRARQNLVDRLEELGIDASVPDLEAEVSRFTERAPYEYTGGGIIYPIGTDRPNVLDPGLTRFDFTSNASDLGFAVELPEGTEVKIRITNHSVGEVALGSGSVWYYAGGSNPLVWSVTQYDFESGVQEFTAKNPGLVDLPSFTFGGSGSATVEYFEGPSDVPARRKEITWSGWTGGPGTRPGEVMPPPGREEPGTGGRGGAGSGMGGGAGYDGYGGSGAEPPTRPEELCGNGTIEMGEECDGANLRGVTCETLMPETSGELSCDPSCTFDRRGCERTCGNGIIDEGEECDPGMPQTACKHCDPECQEFSLPCPT